MALPYIIDNMNIELTDIIGTVLEKSDPVMFCGFVGTQFYHVKFGDKSYYVKENEIIKLDIQPDKS